MSDRYKRVMDAEYEKLALDVGLHLLSLKLGADEMHRQIRAALRELPAHVAPEIYAAIFNVKSDQATEDFLNRLWAERNAS